MSNKPKPTLLERLAWPLNWFLPPFSTAAFEALFRISTAVPPRGLIRHGDGPSWSSLWRPCLVSLPGKPAGRGRRPA